MGLLHHGFVVDFGEGKSENDDPKIVDAGERDDHRPSLHEQARRVEGDVARRFGTATGRIT